MRWWLPEYWQFQNLRGGRPPASYAYGGNPEYVSPFKLNNQHQSWCMLPLNGGEIRHNFEDKSLVRGSERPSMGFLFIFPLKTLFLIDTCPDIYYLQIIIFFISTKKMGGGDDCTRRPPPHLKMCVCVCGGGGISPFPPLSTPLVPLCNVTIWYLVSTLRTRSTRNNK